MTIKDITGHKHVQDQVDIQYEDIPCEQWRRPVKETDNGYQMPCLQGVAQIHENKHQAHDQGANGHNLTDDHNLVQIFVVEDLGWQDYHNGRRRHAHQKREVGYIESPTHDIGHIGCGEPYIKLNDVRIDPKHHQKGQKAQIELIAQLSWQIPEDDILKENNQLTRGIIFHHTFFLHYVLRDCVVLSLRGSETTEAIRPRAFRPRAQGREAQGRGAHGREAIS